MGKEPIEVKVLSIRNTTAWFAVFISIVSLILTFRPFDKDHIIVEGANEIFFYENFGNLIFEQYFSIRNSGKKQGIITSVKGCIVSEDESFKRDISVKYFGGFPFTNIILNENAFLENNMRFFKESSLSEKTTEINFRNTHDSAKELYWKQIASNPNSLPRMYLPDSTYNSIQEFIKSRHVDFKVGKYRYIIAFTKNNEKEPFEVKCYSFEVHDIHIRMLDNAIENYKRIDMIPSMGNYKQNGEYINMEPISDKNIKENLLKMLRK